eukprot:scaffold13067_cov116-Skeletonema_marinoi.AAC.3
MSAVKCGSPLMLNLLHEKWVVRSASKRRLIACRSGSSCKLWWLLLLRSAQEMMKMHDCQTLAAVDCCGGAAA